MTPGDVRERVEEIERMADDDEIARLREDGLWENVLEAIARGDPQPALLAKEALRTRQINFARWYA